jgi:hypothetical protein
MLSKSLFLLFGGLILSLGATQNHPPGIPQDYQLLYEQNFDTWESLLDFEMSDPSAWKWDDSEGGALELFGESRYRARVRSPFNIALLKDHYLGDFILEANLAQSGREYGHRDLCLFFSAKDATNFYYVHIASVMDDHANQIFLVNDEPRVKISSKTTDGTNWGETNSWHKVRIERKVESGSIKIFFDDMNTPIMEATDTHFDYGRIGFGSFDDTGRFDNIKIWAPRSHQAKAGFFN